MRSNQLEKYKNTLQLTELQREVLVGLLLGDAHLETKNSGKTYRLKIEQSQLHSPYVFHLYEMFKDWVHTPPEERVVKVGKHCSGNLRFQTLSHSAFRFYAHQFYTAGKRKVPTLIERWLTERAVAYWFMDDGSIKSKQSKGIIFNTQGFLLSDVERLSQTMNKKFGWKTSLRKQKDGWQIYLSGDSYELFVMQIAPYVIPEMKYKIPKPRQTQLPKE